MIHRDEKFILDNGLYTIKKYRSFDILNFMLFSGYGIRLLVEETNRPNTLYEIFLSTHIGNHF